MLHTFLLSSSTALTGFGRRQGQITQLVDRHDTDTLNPSSPRSNPDCFLDVAELSTVPFIKLFRKIVSGGKVPCSTILTGNLADSSKPVVRVAFCDDGEHETNILVAATLFQERRVELSPIWERGVWDGKVYIVEYNGPR